MHSYRCSSCGAPAYSAANPSTVGACPRCSGPLRLESEQSGRDAARTAAWGHLSDVVAARRTVAADDATRSIVGRLARRHPSGGVAIERAAILADGADSTAVVAWVMAHGGQPEAPAVSVRRGIHSPPLDDPAGAPPLRYVMPAGSLN
jgi:hypothetical protein